MSSTYRNERYISKFVRSPLALTVEKRDEIFMALRARVSGHRIGDDEIAVFLNAAEERRTRYPAAMFEDDDDEPRDPLVRFSADAQGRAEVRADGQVALIPVLGTISFRARSLEDSSGGTSAVFVGRLFDRAVADAGVKSILLDIDSPGGTVDGIPELAARIFAARKVKPVVAIANSMAASAAYWIASQASEFVMIESGYVGSVGVYSIFEDWSAWLEKEGIKVNAISYGANKLEGAPWEPLSDEAREHFQAEVNDIGRAFVAAVAKGRGVTVADVKKNFGQGRVFRGKEALANGMVDRLDSFDNTLARMLKAKGAAGSTGRVAAASQAISDENRELVEGQTITFGEWQGAHGHVTDREDGQRASCGGPDACAVCAAEAVELETARALEAQRQADVDAADAAMRIAERL